MEGEQKGLESIQWRKRIGIAAHAEEKVIMEAGIAVEVDAKNQNVEGIPKTDRVWDGSDKEVIRGKGREKEERAEVFKATVTSATCGDTGQTSAIRRL